MKYISLISCKSGSDRARFRDWYIRDCAPAMVRQAPTAEKFIVSLNDAAPSLAIAARVDLGTPSWDVMTEITLHEERGAAMPADIFKQAFAGIENDLSSRAANSFTYRVTEIVEKDQQAFAGRARSPGVNLISVIKWLPAFSQIQGRLRWRQHGPLARRIHIGMTRYVQNVIEDALTPGAPAYDGIAVLYFPTIEDLEKRLFDSPQGAQTIAADVNGFIGTSETFFATQYVLKQ